MNRRELLWSMITFPIVLACARDPKTSLQRQEPTVQPESWRVLSSIERINRLEKLEYPKTLNLREELTLATAQFYCEETKCKKLAAEMAKSVSFVEENVFIPKLEQELGRKLNPSEKEKEERERVEVVTQDGKILLNEKAFRIFINTVINNQPKPVTEDQKREIEVITTKSILFHAFTHLNGTKKRYDFPPFSLKVGSVNVPEIGRLEGFTFIGKQENGQPFYIKGSDEAITDLAAMIVSMRTGSYISVEQYSRGAGMVEKINRIAGISNEEFLQYANGELPQEVFLQKWGLLKNKQNPDEKAAILALATIGLYVNGVFKYEDTLSGIRNFLGVSIE